MDPVPEINDTDPNPQPCIFHPREGGGGGRDFNVMLLVCFVLYPT